MKRRILGMCLVSATAVALAVLSVPRDRTGPADPGAPSSRLESPARPPGVQALAESPAPPAPVASCRVFESPNPGAPEFRGVGYEAKVTPSGLDLKGPDFDLSIRGTAVEQGGRFIELARGPVRHDAFGRARIEHPVLAEEYVFENRRVEQVFHVPAPLGTGPLRIHSTVETTLSGPVAREDLKGWRETPLEDGGLVFHNERGEKKLAYHGAVAIDAAGNRCPLDPRHENGRITLEVPESFLARASWPVIVDPWLELDFSASGGGVSNTAAVSQTPALAIEGGGNPYVAWAEEVGGNFEIYVRYWNGFSWFSLGSSTTGGGISSNAGQSTNPSIAVVPTGDVFVAWQDDTSGNFEIYLKKWTGAGWVELKGSATGGGVSSSLGESTHPSVAYMRVTVPSKGTVHTVPVVAWQDTTTGPTSIHLAAYFPGDPGQAPDPMNGIPNFPIIYEGWYDIGGSGVWNTGGLSQTPGGFVSEKPVLAIHGTGTTGRVANVTWQDTRDSNYEIYFGQCLITNDGYTNPNTPIYPNSKLPDFNITGTWPDTRPSGVWTLENVSDTGPGDVALEATGLSINPSLTLDAAGNPYVAWEESYDATLSNMEIHAAYGSGLWGPIGSDYNLSTTTAKSTTPSISVGQDGTVYVAWADDEPGNTEIYVKKWLPGGDWESVGFDPSFGIYSAGLGGISRTFSASLFPVVKAGARPVVAWQDFANEQFEIYLRRYYENEPRTPRQMVTLGSPPETSQLPFGGSTTVQTVELRATLFSEDATRMVRLQVEVRPVGSEFVGTVTAQSDLLPVNPGTHLTAEASIPFTGLTNTSYHWRARTVDDLGRASAWISVGYNLDGAADFTINSIPPVPPNPPQNLVAQTNGMQIQLSWDPPGGGTDLTYDVYRSESSPVPVAPAATPHVSGLTSTTHADSNVLPNKTYYYVVLALDVAKQASEPSNEASATTPSPPIAAPTNVQAVAGYNRITLNWEAVAGSTQYDVKRNTTNDVSTYTTIASGLTATTYEDGGLPDNATYYYWVAARNAAGSGPDSDPVSATTLPPSAPSAPTNLTATGGDGQISLSWSPSSGTPPFTYNVKRSTVSGGPYTTVATGVSATAYTDINLAPATTYYYVVTGVNGYGESPPSSQASATTNLLSGPPPAPQNLTAASAGPTSIQLAWSPVVGAGAVVYNVSQATASAGPFETVATGLMGTNYTVNGLTTATEYFFVVTAQNGSGSSGPSNVASAIPLAPPTAPAGVQAVGGPNQITVSWGAVAGATSYEVKRSPTATGTFVTLASGITATSYTDTGLPDEITYYYRVAAWNAAGSGPDSAAVSAKTNEEDDDRHCGLLGLEALLALGILGGLRRRR